MSDVGRAPNPPPSLPRLDLTMVAPNLHAVQIARWADDLVNVVGNEFGRLIALVGDGATSGSEYFLAMDFGAGAPGASAVLAQTLGASGTFRAGLAGCVMAVGGAPATDAVFEVKLAGFPLGYAVARAVGGALWLPAAPLVVPAAVLGSVVSVTAPAVIPAGLTGVRVTLVMDRAGG